MIFLRLGGAEILYGLRHNGVDFHGGKPVIRRVQAGQADMLSQRPYSYLLDSRCAGIVNI